ncbi:MAG: YhdP family protein [Burkholderiales bacterium]
MAPQLAVRLLRVTGTVIVTAVVLLLALLLLVRYVVFPSLDDHRDRIAASLTRELGQPVSIEGIAGGWDGWNPRLTIRGVAIRERTRPEGEPVLLLPQVDLTVAWTSLATMKLRLRELAIERPQLSIRRDKDGRFHVAGFEIDTGTQRDDSQVTDWLLNQREIVVREALVMWNDELRGAPQLVLDNVTFRLEQSFGRVRFGLTGSPPAMLAAPLELRGEVSAASLRELREMRGRFYVRLDYADVAHWREWFPVLRPVETGDGAVRIWFDVAGGRLTNVVADLELTDARMRIAPDLPLLDLVFVRGHLTWQHEDSKITVGGRDLAFRTRAGEELSPVAFTVAMNEAADGAITGGSLEFDKLDVPPLSTLAVHLPFPERWRRDLAVLALRGSVSDGKLAWSGPPEAPVKFSASGAFSRFGIAAAAGLPGAASVSGNFTFDESRGELKLDSRDMRVVLPRVFADELIFTTASGRVGWTREEGRLRLTFEDVRFATPHTSGTASGSWQAREKGPGALDLRAQLVRGSAQNLYRYLPLTLNNTVRDWLRSAIRQGTASDVRMLLSGELSDFPFTDSKAGQFLLTFKANDVTLDYASGWPALTDIDGDVRFEGPGMVVNARSARVSGVQIGPAKAEIPNLGADSPMLNVQGEATGATSDFLRFVNGSPVGGWIDHFTDHAQATGNGKLSLKLALPLGNPEATKASGDYQFLANTLRLPSVPLLTQVNGHLDFAENGMRSRELAGEVLGSMAKIAVVAQDGAVRVNAGGTINVATLKREFDLPMPHRVSGATDWTFAAQSRAGASSWVIESNLKGVGLEFPAPLGKLPSETVPLRIERRETPGKGLEDTLTVDLRTDLRVIAHRDLAKGTATVDRVLMLLGNAAKRGGAADRPGIFVRGDIADFDVDEWLALYAKESAREAQGGAAAGHTLELNGVDIAAGRIDVFGRVLHDIEVNASRAESDWRLRVAARELAGTASWKGPAPGLPNGRVMARLSRFQPPGPDELNPVRSEVDVNVRQKNTWPELDIVADAFITRNGHDVGAFELLAQPVGPDWRIGKMSLVNPSGRIEGNGWWRIARDKQATELDVQLTTEDAGAFLDRFGYPVAVRNAPTKISGSLQWAGAPNDFDYPSLTGKLSLRTGAGQFTKIDPGIGKLLGVLSLQSLPRRITLDFRDVFSEGFAFDDIVGDFNIEKGLIHTDNLRLEGPAAAVTLTGNIDLARETQALDVRVKPALSSMASAGAAVLFLANPIVGAAVGAGTLLAQKLLNDPLDQIFSYDYRVSGSWTDPQVERVERRVVTSAPPAQR